MMKVCYPKGDPRRHDAILPHGSDVKVIGSTPNLRIVEHGRQQHLVHPDFLREYMGNEPADSHTGAK